MSHSEFKKSESHREWLIPATNRINPNRMSNESSKSSESFPGDLSRADNNFKGRSRWNRDQTKNKSFIQYSHNLCKQQVNKQQQQQTNQDTIYKIMFGKKGYPAPCVMGDEKIMAPKAHGTSEVCLLLHVCC
jgi:hypothetical protein